MCEVQYEYGKKITEAVQSLIAKNAIKTTSTNKKPLLVSNHLPSNKDPVLNGLALCTYSDDSSLFFTDYDSLCGQSWLSDGVIDKCVEILLNEKNSKTCLLCTFEFAYLYFKLQLY